MIELFIILVLFYFTVLWLKISLFYLYLWQLKEYRIDRMAAYLESSLGEKEVISRFNIFSWQELKRPKITFRIILTFLLLVFLNYKIFFWVLKPVVSFLELTPSWFVTASTIIFLILILLSPLMVSFVNLLLEPFFYLFKQLIINFARVKRASFKDLIVIGITGSYGKTATKEILTQVLSAKYKVLSTPGTRNTDIGVAMMILDKLRNKHQVFVVEMGAYRKGEIKKICSLVKPNAGIITGINEQHLALFGNLFNTFWTKYELIKSLPANGLAVFNGENTYTKRMAKITKNVKVKTYLLPKRHYKTNLVGDFHQLNIQAALAVSDWLKVPRSKARIRLKKIKLLQGLKIKKTRRGYFLIDDSNNSNPAGFKEALKILASFKNRKKMIVTMGIVDLGKKERKIHQELGFIMGEIADWIVLTNRGFDHYIKKGVEESGMEPLLQVVDNREKLKETIRRAGRDFAILIEGRVPIEIGEIS